MTKQELAAEYSKCLRDTPYALRTYLETYDNTQQMYVPFVLFPDQEKLINDYDTYNENLALKYRQAGVSTATAAWASKKLQFASPKRPEKILIIANKLDTAKEMLTKVRGFLNQWPDWINVGFSKDKDSQSHFRLNNSSEVKAVATSMDALRGYTPTILIFDEAAYIEAGDDFWAACMASLSTGGKVIVVSTPNGFDKIYYEIYAQSQSGMNDFKITEMVWYKDPRFTKDLVWVKCKDIIHYMLNREQYEDSDVLLKNNNQDEFSQLMKDGYKPYSGWFEQMSKKLKYDRRKISQELENNFLGSGDNVIPADTIERIKNTMIEEPKEKYMAGQLWLWKEPIKGHRYIMGVDVSRGDSEDFSSITIIDFDTREQVVEYLGKIPPDELADVCFKWGTMYSAFTVVDITGGMGVATVRKLQELGYKDLYTDGVNAFDKWSWNPKAQEKMPGLSFNSKRTQIVASFEEALRHNFVVRSSRLVNEMNTFVYINGKADHMKGQHDDLIMAIAMCIYVGEFSFSLLKASEESTKALLEGWTVTEREKIPGGIFSPTSSPYDPLRGLQNNGNRRNNVATQQDYQDFSWLMKSRRRKS
jgi:hypothetical protein